MSWPDYLSKEREKYMDFYGSVLRRARAEGKQCTPEVWVEPNVPPGKKRPEHPLCVDIMIQTDEGPQMAMVSGEPITGTLIEKTAYGRAALRVYELTWENLAVWVRHPQPDWALLVPWTSKWMDANRGGDAANDGLSGVVHYIGSPIAEGGGYLFQMDFGSAPVEAVTELMDIFRNMGATEMELGRSDGSDLPAHVLAELQKPEISLQALVETMIMAIKDLGGVREVQQVNEGQLELFIDDEKEPRKAHLGNLHRMLKRVGAEARPGELYRFVRAQRETMHLDTPDLDQLRLTIKDNRFLANLQAHAPHISLLAKPWIADLWLVSVWDGPNGMRFTVKDEPAKYGMTAEQMLQRARDNGVQEHAPADVNPHGPIWAARTGDSYDASLILDDAWVTEMAGKMKGELLACVPARHVVLLGDSSDSRTFPEMQNAARQVESGGDHLISGTVLVWREGEWRQWTPGKTIPEPMENRDGPDAGAPLGKAKSEASKKPWWKFW